MPVRACPSRFLGRDPSDESPEISIFRREISILREKMLISSAEMLIFSAEMLISGGKINTSTSKISISREDMLISSAVINISARKMLISLAEMSISSPPVRRGRLLFANRHRPRGLFRRVRTIGNRLQTMPDREGDCKLSRDSHQNSG